MTKQERLYTISMVLFEIRHSINFFPRFQLGNKWIDKIEIECDEMWVYWTDTECGRKLSSMKIDHFKTTEITQIYNEVKKYCKKNNIEI